MFVQTQKTPNPNSLKFLPGRKVSQDGPYEILNKDETDNHLIRNILSINGVTGIFLSEDFLSVNKLENEKWENIQHIVISYINEYYSEGNEFIIDKSEGSDLLIFLVPSFRLIILEKFFCINGSGTLRKLGTLKFKLNF